VFRVHFIFFLDDLHNLFILIGKINKKKRPLGRPRTRMKDTVEKDMRLIECNVRLNFGQRKTERLTSGSAGP
jgi:hypothetical protein